MHSIWREISKEVEVRMGEVVAFATTHPATDDSYETGLIVLKRERPPFPNRPFSVHHWALTDRGEFYMFTGTYDLEAEQAARVYTDDVANSMGIRLECV